jgi:hypothetical protein
MDHPPSDIDPRKRKQGRKAGEAFFSLCGLRLPYNGKSGINFQLFFLQSSGKEFFRACRKSLFQKLIIFNSENDSL